MDIGTSRYVYTIADCNENHVIVLGISTMVLVFLHARSFEKSCVDYLYFEFVKFEVILCVKVGFCPVVVSQFQSLVCLHSSGESVTGQVVSVP